MTQGPSNNDQLAIALRARNFAAADQALVAGADLNALTPNGSPLIHLYADNNGVEQLKWLLANGANPDAVNRRGDTALMHAVTNSARHAVNALVAGGVNPNLCDRDGISPLLRAVQLEQDHGVLSEILAAPGLMVDQKTASGVTPLIAAAAQGHLKAVIELLSAGADPESVDFEGRGAMHAAISSGKPPVLAAILDYAQHLDPDYAQRTGTSAMALAAMSSSTPMIGMLLARGGDPNARPASAMQSYVTPLLSVISSATKDTEQVWMPVLEDLLKAGAKVNDRATEKGLSPIGAALMSGNTTAAQVLIQHGADPTRPLDNTLSSPYLLAAMMKPDPENPDRPQQLITALNRLGVPMLRTPWDEAIDGRLPRKKPKVNHIVKDFMAGPGWPLIKHLISLGLSVNAADPNDETGMTPIHILAASGFDGATRSQRLVLKKMAEDPAKADMVKKLEDDAAQSWKEIETMALRRADLSVCDATGRSALHHASTASWINALLKMGADPMLRDNAGLTPAAAAFAAGRMESFKTLLAAQQDQTTALVDVAGLSLPIRAESALLDSLFELTWSSEQIEARCPNTGLTALTRAAGADKLSMMARLLKAGADVDSADASGNTALMYAVYKENHAMVSTLIDAGADPTVCNATGQNALDVAAYVKNKALDALLQDAMKDKPARPSLVKP